MVVSQLETQQLGQLRVIMSVWFDIKWLGDEEKETESWRLANSKHNSSVSYQSSCLSVWSDIKIVVWESWRQRVTAFSQLKTQVPSKLPGIMSACMV